MEQQDDPLSSSIDTSAHDRHDLFLTIEERPRVIGSLRDVLPPGSYLTATHATKDGKSPDVVTQVESIYATTPTPMYLRDHAEIVRFFDGFDLLE